ncbi:lipopolysaccharide transport periplasmic protein LptA [Rhodobacteraceae bacterium RKSG542]|uniref:lipopolysaccharide transport periplasmic protein LptA n=1 Tax=Pseudovibrio flavus TaxID=2529854 RepID=UPI0012BCAB6D|nr:lipopolysaccharide transport periplasmic protein LptA [Pseudovibrio flavus]MTI17775.1 lipopolysaccharide transport periplasmic protein LptA [Pseudovibrio flavus]
MTFGARVLCAALALTLSTSIGAYAQTFSDAFAGFGSDSKEPIEIEATNLQVQDQSKSATFSGNVIVTQGESKLKTNKLVVFYSGSMADQGEQNAVQQTISRIEAYGNVYISSKDQVATGDEASFDMDKELMVMTGKEVVLSQGPNVVVGSKLIVNLKTGKVDLDAPGKGRVKLLLQPKSLEKR